MERFTHEELIIAKNVDLVAVANYLGYTVKRVGRYHTLQEMDSIRIYDRTHWYRFSRENEKGRNGGSQIDFLRVFEGMEIKEAVSWLLDFIGYQKNEREQVLNHSQISEKKKEEQKPFQLPVPATQNNYLYQYLIQKRAIRKDIVEYFVGKGLIYETKKYHNIAFLGKDKAGNICFASLRGTHDDKDGKGFRCDVSGSNKNYGFCDLHEKSNEVIVFEAAIDLMSYMELYNDLTTSKLALGMVSDRPLETFLRDYPSTERIRICLDTDEAGRKAAYGLKKKYEEKGYQITVCFPPKEYKDYNHWLQSEKGKCFDKGCKKEAPDEKTGATR